MSRSFLGARFPDWRFSVPTRTTARQRATPWKPFLEALEDRTLLSLQIFHNQPDWQAAVGGPNNTTAFHFDGPTELDGRFANNTSINPSYSSQGVDFLPFNGSNVFPQI